MVDLLFRGRMPSPDSRILDPGCGTGAFIGGIVRWCEKHGAALPHIVGIDSDPRHIPEARDKFRRYSPIEIRHEDFLQASDEKYDFVVGNPPYVPITELSEEEKTLYRGRFSTAQGRFDLYLLFFEQALRRLKTHGRLVFITPEKFLYVDSAVPLRRLLSVKQVEEIRLVDEDTFAGLVTYPTITTVTNAVRRSRTSFVRRDGSAAEIHLPKHGGSWLARLNREPDGQAGLTLADITIRISCGVATGADSVFVRRTGDLDAGLAQFAYTTIAGRELGPANPTLKSRYSILVPYTKRGKLLDERGLGSLGSYLAQRPIHARLLRRTCAKRKPWYAFHETPPLGHILRPKILCKDITARPEFWIDKTGRLVPRHSTYYIVPKSPGQLEEICAYLNSETAIAWLRTHCQRAAKGFFRVQSRVLKQLPVPPELAASLDPSRERSLFGTETPTLARNPAEEQGLGAAR